MSEAARDRIVMHDLDCGSIAPAPGVIAPGRKVTMHFSLELAEGSALQLAGGDVIDSNFDKAPATFVVGDGSLLPGFEQVLLGLVAGDKRDVTLEPAQAFGLVNEDNVQRFPLYQFPPDLALTPGLMVEFADAAGNNQAGVVRSIDKQWVEVDFNHPLAGRAIRFRVHVHDVTQVAPAQVEQA